MCEASECGFSRIVPVTVSTTMVSAAKISAGSAWSSLAVAWPYTACAFLVAVARTYSNGCRVLGKSSGSVEGMISMLGRPRRERIWRRRGEAEARITRLVRRSLRKGRLRGGGRGRGCRVAGAGAVVVVAGAAS